MALTLQCRLGGIGGFQKRVVVKMMQPHLLESPEIVQMFLDEARLCAGLVHPNIPQIFEVGEENGLPYLVMEHIAGPDLAMVRRMMPEGSEVEYGVIANIFSQVARALAYAHDLKDDAGRPIRIIHRDVSLPNILVGSDGVARLIDFGIARSDMSSAVTEIGTLKGRVAYMSPEQLIGKPIDHRVDIYQLGVCLYWMTTGSPPYTGDNPVAIWNAHIGRTLTRPSERVPGYPLALEAIVMKAMAETPEARYASALEVAEALEAFCRAGRWQSSTEHVRLWIHRIVPPIQFQTSQSPAAQSPALGGADGSLGSSAGLRPVQQNRLLTPAAMPSMSGQEPSALPVPDEHGYSERHVIVPSKKFTQNEFLLKWIIGIGIAIWLLAGLVIWNGWATEV